MMKLKLTLQSRKTLSSITDHSWLYYISGNTLCKKNLESDRATHVECQYIWFTYHFENPSEYVKYRYSIKILRNLWFSICFTIYNISVSPNVTQDGRVLRDRNGWRGVGITSNWINIGSAGWRVLRSSKVDFNDSSLHNGVVEHQSHSDPTWPNMTLNVQGLFRENLDSLSLIPPLTPAKKNN